MLILNNMKQIKLHRKIQKLVNNDPCELKKEELISLFSEAKNKKTEQDAKNYFFYKADEKWIDWLFENGFFEVLKQKAEDTSSYRYKTPELNYLAKVAEKVPEKVTKVILSTPISEDNFNPEVIDRFIFITSELKASEIKKIVKKMYKER